MRQRRHRHRLHVVRQDEVASANRGLGPRELQQGEAAAGRGAERHSGIGSRGLHQRHDVALERPADEHVFEGRLHRQKLGAGDERRDRRGVGAPLAADAEDIPLGVVTRIADADPQEEAVELRLGQRIGPLQLDGVLRGDDQEGLPERERLPLHRDLRLLHGFQQRGLGLGRGAVDLVGEQQIGEDGPGAKLEPALALIVEKAAR